MAHALEGRPTRRQRTLVGSAVLLVVPLLVTLAGGSARAVDDPCVVAGGTPGSDGSRVTCTFASSSAATPSYALTLPLDATEVTVVAKGGAGGSSLDRPGGLGATVSGGFRKLDGETLTIVVGGNGGDIAVGVFPAPGFPNGGVGGGLAGAKGPGGGGSSSVTHDSTLLIVAGAGGGSGQPGIDPATVFLPIPRGGAGGDSFKDGGQGQSIDPGALGPTAMGGTGGQAPNDASGVGGVGGNGGSAYDGPNGECRGQVGRSGFSGSAGQGGAGANPATLAGAGGGGGGGYGGGGGGGSGGYCSSVNEHGGGGAGGGGSSHVAVTAENTSMVQGNAADGSVVVSWLPGTPDNEAPAVTISTTPSEPSGFGDWFNIEDLGSGGISGTGSDLVVTATADDGQGSGVASIACTLDGTATATPSFAVGQGVHIVSCTATDLEGNTSEPVTATYRVDSIAPYGDGPETRTTPTGDGGNWFNASDLGGPDGTLDVSYYTSDTIRNGSGTAVTECFAGATLLAKDVSGRDVDFEMAGDAARTVRCTVMDNAGNRDTDSATFRIDTHGPTIACTSAAPGPDFVRPTDATTLTELGSLTATASDPKAGSGMGTNVTTFTAKVFYDPADGSTYLGPWDHEHTADIAGNQSSPPATCPFTASDPDTTPPTISASATTADSAPYTAGTWTNQEVTVTFDCSDGGSGIATCTGPATVSEEGDGQSRDGSAVDNVGLSADTTFGPVRIDLTDPTVTGSATKADGSAYVTGTWTNQSVGVDFVCDDELSGLATCTGDTTLTGDTSTAGTTPAGGAVDLAGNEVSGVSFGPVRIDKTAPAVAFTDCPTSPVVVGTTVTVHWQGTDGLSGLLGTTSGSAALATTAIGGASVQSGTVTDSAGNVSTAASCAYAVGYALQPPVGFFSPAPGSKWKQGQTVPIKIALGDAAGNRVPACTACTVTFMATKGEGGTGQSTGPVAMKYDASTGQYIYSWKLGKQGTGLTTLTVTITYPNSALTTTHSETIVIST